MSLLLIRPFHIVHQWMVIYLAVTVRGIWGEIPLPTLFLLWVQTFLVMPLLFIINDLLHVEDDRKMGKKRLFTNNTLTTRSASIISTGIFVTIGILSYLRSIYNFGFYVFLFYTASSYGYFKHKRRTNLTYLFRALSGFSLYLFVASYFGLFELDIYLAVFVALSDLSGHIIGDVRDIKKDREAGVRTLPVVLGVGRSNIAVLILQIFTAGLLYTSTLVSGSGALIPDEKVKSLLPIPLEALIPLGLLYLASWIIYLLFIVRKEERYKWAHSCFHGSKILSFLVIGLMVTKVSIQDAILIGISVFIIWYLFYRAYLWADHRL